MPGLTFYNNHLDAEARFDTSAVDDATTSRDNDFAIGEKGKGFILAAQYLFEDIDERSRHLTAKREDAAKDTGKMSQGKDVKSSVSFRIGHMIGDLAWKKSCRSYGLQLNVTMDDLTPWMLEEFLN